MTKRFSSAGVSIVALVLALFCVPALVRATQQLGHGPKVKQVCGLSTSESTPPDRVAPMLAATIASTFRVVPPRASAPLVCGALVIPTPFTPFRSSPRAPPASA